MVIIKFSPVYTGRSPRIESASVEGYAITIFDSPLFADKAVMSVDGTLSVTLLMPYDEATATDAIRFPAPVTVTTNGPVDIPTDHPAPPPAIPTIEADHGLLPEQENLH
ncbi:hypothetical protein AO265_20925 [Pseudomonas sp. ABAC61]|nr:hypothetical protein AO265_20925 [Pseudomonas sp. ABAC61]